MLYVDFYDIRSGEMRDEDLQELQKTLSDLPSVSLAADVSGRVAGTAEVLAFIRYFLRQHRGVVTDDYTTAERNYRRSKNSRTSFFDYLGWNEELKNC